MRVKDNNVPVGFKERFSQIVTKGKRIYSDPFDRPYIIDLRTRNVDRANKSRVAGIHKHYKFENGRWWESFMLSDGSVGWR